MMNTELKRMNKLNDVGGVSYVTLLANVVPTAANAKYHAQIVEEKSIFRQLVEGGTTIAALGYDGMEDVRNIMDKAEEIIFHISNRKGETDFAVVSDVLGGTINHIQKILESKEPITGLATGYKDLDYLTAGLHPSDFIILAARPSMGKTALALNIAQNVAVRGVRADGKPMSVGIFSLEMPALSLILRMICSESRVGLAEFRNKTINASRWTDVMRAADSLNKAKIVIDDTGAIDILELRAKARRMKAKHNVEAIFVDYLQLIRAHTKSNASRENEVSMISGSLKAMAKELNIPVVVLAQLNRQAEQGEKPKLSQLRESGAIEQDADVVALLHREREKQHEQKDDDNSGLLSELIIAKNRNGATGTAELLFFPKYTRFENKANADSGDVPAGEF